MNRNDFVFDETTRGISKFSALNPTLHEVKLVYDSKRHSVRFSGRSNEDITDFAEDITLNEIKVHISPYHPYWAGR